MKIINVILKSYQSIQKSEYLTDKAIVVNNTPVKIHHATGLIITRKEHRYKGNLRNVINYSVSAKFDQGAY